MKKNFINDYIILEKENVVGMTISHNFFNKKKLDNAFYAITKDKKNLAIVIKKEAFYLVDLDFHIIKKIEKIKSFQIALMGDDGQPVSAYLIEKK